MLREVLTSGGHTCLVPAQGANPRHGGNTPGGSRAGGAGMGILKDGIGGAVASALESSDGAVSHQVEGVTHEVAGPQGGAVRHEVLGESGAVIQHRLGDLRLAADRISVDPVAVQVPPLVVRVDAEALARLRLRVPAEFTLRLSLFGREVARLDLSGAARVEADQDPAVT